MQLLAVRKPFRSCSCKLWDNRDPNKIASVFDADAELVDVTAPGGAIVRDPERAWSCIVSYFQPVYLASRAQKVKRLSDDIASCMRK